MTPLEKWRKERADAQAAGGKVWAAWQKAHPPKKKEKVIKITPMQAIKKFCLACVGGSEDGTAGRTDVKNCTAPKCALYPLRPYK